MLSECLAAGRFVMRLAWQIAVTSTWCWRQLWRCLRGVAGFAVIDLRWRHSLRGADGSGSNAMTTADRWLNAEHRREFFIWVCVGVVVAGLIGEVLRLTRRTFLISMPRHGSPSLRAARSEVRFWCLVWVSIAVLVQLRSLDSWWVAFRCVAIIALVLAGATMIGEFERRPLPRHVWNLGEALEPWWSALGWSIETTAFRGASIWLSMPLLLPWMLIVVLVVPGLRWESTEEGEGRVGKLEEPRLFALEDISELRRGRGGRFYLHVALEGGRTGRIVFVLWPQTREEALAKLNARVTLDGRRFVEECLENGLRL
jgi:hypothetical protein